MASSRTLLTKNPKHKPIFAKKMGRPTSAEKELVAQFVADQPCEVTPRQIQGLAKTFRRSKEVIKAMIEEARENFVVSAGRYVEIHQQATEAALADGDNEQAIKGSQWAMQNIASEGVRIIDKPTVEQTGTKIMIGVKLGGMNAAVGAKVEDV